MAKRPLAAVEKEDQPTRFNPFIEIGTTGLRHWGGRIDEEWLKELKGSNETKIYREMSENSPIIGAVLLAIEQLLRGVNIIVKNGSDDNEGRRAGDLVRTCLEDMSSTWADTLTEKLTMFTYGWAWLETVYKHRNGDSRNPTQRSRYTDGLVGWRKMALRAQETLTRFDMDDEGGVQAMIQQDTARPGVRVIPLEKSCLYRTKTVKGNPKGRSLLRNAFLPYFYVRRIQTIEGIGIERDLAGFPVMGLPVEYFNAAAGTSEAAILESCKKLVSNIRRDEQEGATIPLEYDQNGNERFKLSLLSTGGQRQFDTGKVIERHERRMAMVALADFILLGHERVGSLALSSDKTDIFATALAGWLDSILAVLNRHAIPRVLRLNGMPIENPPILTHADIETPSLAELGTYIQALAGSGMLLWPSPDGQLESAVLSAASLPVPVETEGPVGKRNVEWLGLLTEAASEMRKAAEEFKRDVTSDRIKITWTDGAST